MPQQQQQHLVSELSSKYNELSNHANENLINNNNNEEVKNAKNRHLMTVSKTPVRNYEKEEVGQCVLYVTSMAIVRENYENCKKIKAILNQHFIQHEERDIYLNHRFRHELIERCGRLVVPSLFVDGKLFGGLKEVETLNEAGLLPALLARFKSAAGKTPVCPSCGDARHIPCDKCSGSRRSLILHYFSESIILRCSKCEATGIIRCPTCYPAKNVRVYY